MQQKQDRGHQIQVDESSIRLYMSRGSAGSPQGNRDNTVAAGILGNIVSDASLWRRQNDDFAATTCELQANSGCSRTGKLHGETKSFGQPNSDGNPSLQNQNVGTIVFPAIGEHPSPDTPMEAVGLSIAWTTNNPHSEHNILGRVQAPGQSLVYQDFHGLQHARMVLPIELAEEPVYVNAKQYHGILRRRQLRAKAELENKLPKVRKPYLHESRHLHAMRRARGCGGRFLSTKKFEADAKKNTSKTASGTSSGGTRSSQDSELGFPTAPGNVDFASNHDEVGNRSLQGRMSSDLSHWGSSAYQWKP